MGKLVVISSFVWIDYCVATMARLKSGNEYKLFHFYIRIYTCYIHQDLFWFD